MSKAPQLGTVTGFQPVRVWRQQGVEASCWVYCLTEDRFLREGPCKVGVAAHLNKRMSSLQGGNWRQLHIAWLLHVEDKPTALRIEDYLLEMFRPSCYDAHPTLRRLKSEWLDAASDQVLTRALYYGNAFTDDALQVVA
jgi:hypothetical protein